MKLNGIISAFVTPMDDWEQIAEKELQRQVDRQIRAGACAVFCSGTNGEAYALSFEERLRVTALSAEAADGRVPVMCGTGCVTTAETIALSREAVRHGADLLSVVLPYFAAASQEELYRHFCDVADAAPVPILIYNIPARTGNAIQLETAARLAEHPNIAGIKDSSGNFEQIKGYIEIAKSQDFQVLCGTDSLILPTLQAGGTGAISAVTNVLPELVYRIYRDFAAGDLEGAAVAQQAIQPIRDCFKYGNPNTIVKYATACMGYPVGKPRRPFCVLSEEAKTAVRQTIDAHYQQYVLKEVD